MESKSIFSKISSLYRAEKDSIKVQIEFWFTGKEETEFQKCAEIGNEGGSISISSHFTSPFMVEGTNY